MAMVLSAIAYLLLFGGHALAVDPGVRAFDYEFSVKGHAAWKNHYGISVKYDVLMFRGESLEKVPGDAVWYPVFLSATSSPDGIDAVAEEERPFVGKPHYPPEKSLRAFHFQIESLQLKPDGQVPVLLRFKDATDTYSLRCVEGEGLRLEAVEAKHGKISAATVPEFVNLKQTQDAYVWQCNSLTVSASKDGKALWAKDIPMQGQPESMSVLDKVLFVATTGGHSFYVWKETGDLLFYDASIMTGRVPADDIRAIWKKEMAMTYRERDKRGYSRFIKAAVKLDDRRSIPLLIECVEHGQGLEEKCAAIAALEKFNGDLEAWPDPLPKISSYFLRRVGMGRVFPADKAKAERRKWEGVFKDQLQK